MEEVFPHRGFRLAFQTKNIHTAAMILLLLIGMLAAEDSVTKADQVLVVKSQRTLTLLSHGKVLHTYKVALGGSPVGAKEQQGDRKSRWAKALGRRRGASAEPAGLYRDRCTRREPKGRQAAARKFEG